MPFIIWGPAGVSECVYIIYTHMYYIVWCYDRTFYLKSWMCACVLARRWLVCRPKMAGSDFVFFFKMARQKNLTQFEWLEMNYWKSLCIGGRWQSGDCRRDFVRKRWMAPTTGFDHFDTKKTARSISMCFGTLIVFNFKCMNISGLARTERSLSEKIQRAAFSLGRVAKRRICYLFKTMYGLWISFVSFIWSYEKYKLENKKL